MKGTTDVNATKSTNKMKTIPKTGNPYMSFRWAVKVPFRWDFTYYTR